MTALSRRTAALVALAAAAVLFVAVNLVAGHWLRAARIDLTQKRLFTVSEGTKKTLARIDEPITLRFYYSPRLGDEIPSYGVYAQRVRNTLEEYTALAKGKIKLEVLNPEPFSAIEDRAVAFGLQGVPLDQGEESIYFGLAGTNSTDDQEVIPFFQPERERFLEYDLTKLIHSLAVPKKTVVGLMTTLPLEGDMMAAMQGRPLEPYMVLEQLRQLYEVRTLATELDEIPADVDVLWIAHPQHYSDKTLYAIDQFVLKGGKALVFVDPYSETQAAHASRMAPGGPGASDLDKLFAAWGLEMEKGKVAGDRRNGLRVNAGGETRARPIEYVAWLGLKTDAINRDDPITADITQLNLATAGVLKQREGAKTSFEPLISTSADAELLPIEKVEGVPDVAALLADFKSENRKFVLAARITGPADTAFPDGPPAAKSDKEKGDKEKTDKPADPAPAAALKTSAQPINLVVVADTDMLDDRFWVQVRSFFGQRLAEPTAGNGDFVANAVDVLAGGNDLLGLRTRGSSARPFEVVQQIQRDADLRFEAHEKELEQQLKDTKEKIRQLQGKDPNQPNVTLAAEQNKTLDDFRAQMLKVRRELRQVKLDQREDTDRLKARLEFFNIALVPLLVALAAAILGFVRLQRRKRRAAAA